MNTIVSFACSVGFVDFLKDHHTDVTSHLHDKPHHHEKASSHSHTSEAGDHHNKPAVTTTSSSENENNCCSDEVLKLSTLDKAVTSINHHPLPLPVEVMAIVYSFLLSDYYFPVTHLIKPKPPFDRSWALSNHTNLRIAIQSFQI